MSVSVHAHVCAQAPVRARGKAVRMVLEEAQAGSDAVRLLVRSVTVSFTVTEQDASSWVRKRWYYLGLLHRHGVVHASGNF